MSTRIGLLGGTFDPPHLGHLVVAEVARVALELDAFHLVVAGDPWMKSEISPAEDRIRMVELAVADDPHLHVNRMEVDREGPTYTAETLRDLRRTHPDADLVFLVGADAAQKMGEWKQIEQALQLADFVVISRPGYEVALDHPLLEGVTRLPVPSIGVSSTDLRRRFREHDAVRYQLPDGVESYVRAHGLYGAKPEAPGR